MSCLKCGSDDVKYKITENSGGSDAVAHLCERCKQKLQLGGFEPGTCSYSNDCVNLVQYTVLETVFENGVAQTRGTTAVLCEDHYQELVQNCTDGDSNTV